MAESVAEAVERLNHHDPTLKHVILVAKQLTDSKVAELVDCLLAHPDVVKRMCLSYCEVTDETGVKLARYVAASSTVQALDLRFNQLGAATYLELAAALRVNSSLRALYLLGNQAVDRTRIEAAFVEALRLNPDRPADSEWLLYSYGSSLDVDFKRLKEAADRLGHPSLQTLMAFLCDRT